MKNKCAEKKTPKRPSAQPEKKSQDGGSAMKHKKNESKSKWERERRDRVKEAFLKLESLILIANSSETGNRNDKGKLSNIDVLQKATLLIENLQKQISDLKILLKEPNEESEREIRIYLRVLNGKLRKLNIKLHKIIAERNKKKNITLKRPLRKTSTKISSAAKHSIKRLRKRPKQKNDNIKNKKNTKEPLKSIFSATPQILPKCVIGNGLKNGIVTATTTPNQTLFLLRPDLIMPPAPSTLFLLPPVSNHNTLPTFAPTATTTVNRMPIPAYSHALSAKFKKLNTPSARKRISHHARLRIYRDIKESNICGNNKSKKESVKKNTIKLNDVLEKGANLENNEINKSNNLLQKLSNEKETIQNNKTCNNSSEVEKLNDYKDTEKSNQSMSDKIVEQTVQNSSDNNVINENNLKEDNRHLEKIVKDLQNSEVNLQSDEIIAQIKVIDPSEQKKETISEIVEATYEEPLTKKTKMIENDDHVLNINKEIPRITSCEENNTVNNVEVGDASNSDIVGGRSRLELAEELLAASPTAAFLLTFPLVSATRPDTPEDGTRMQSDVSRTPVPNSVVTTSASASINTIVSQSNNDGLDGLASFFSSKEAQFSKNLYSDKSWTAQHPTSTESSKPEYPPKMWVIDQPTSAGLSKPTYLSKESSSCAMSNIFHNGNGPPPIISSSYPTKLVKDNSVNSFDNQEQLINTVKPSQILLDKNVSYKQSNGLNVEKSNDKITNESIETNLNGSTGNNYYNFGSNQYYTQGKAIEKMSNVKSASTLIDNNINSHNNYMQKSQSKDLSARTICDGDNVYNNYFPVNVNNHASETGNQTKMANVYPEYNISNIYSQSVNMWNEEVTYHDLNTQNSVNSKQGNHTSRNNYSVHYGNYSNNFYKTFIPTSSASIANTPHKSDLVQNCNQKPKSSISIKQPVLDNKYAEDRNIKKTPNKAPVNWMTSEARLPQSAINSYTSNSYNKGAKFDYVSNSYTMSSINALEPAASLTHHDNLRKSEYQDNQFYSIPPSNYGFQMSFDDCQQNWNASKLQKPDEMQLDPPATLPTLLGDLALGTLERRRPTHTVPPPIMVPSIPTSASTQETFPTSSTFFSVSQLVEQPSTIVPVTRSQFSVDSRKIKTSKPENSVIQNKYQNVDSFPHYSVAPPANTSHSQLKVNSNSCAQQRLYKNKQQDVSKQCKSNYSAEALIRGVTQTNWGESSASKSSKSSIEMPKQYSDLTPLHDSQYSQMPHFTPVLDLGENLNLPQQYSSNSFAYSTTPTSIAPSFYPSHSFMPSNYMGSTFLPDFMDFSNTPTDNNNFSLPKLDTKTKEKKTLDQSLSKNTAEQKSSTLGLKQKSDHNVYKRDSNKKSNQKRPKGYIDTGWLGVPNDLNIPPVSSAITSPLLTDDAFLSYFPTSQVYQSTPNFPVPTTHSHVEPTGHQPLAHQSSCSLTTIATTKTNFNLSTIFPEINKQQSTSIPYCTNVPGINRIPQNKNIQEFHYRNQSDLRQ